MRKINVIGTSGTGKSRFSKKLAKKLNAEYIEMDAIHWQDNWQALDDKAFFDALEKHLQTSTWVLDGNYTRTIPVKWCDVDTVIWLHYPFWLVLCRAIRRAVTRVITREKLWNTNNTESITKLFSKDSIVWWTISIYRKQEQCNYALMANPEYAHIQFIEFTSPKQAQAFLDT